MRRLFAFIVAVSFLAPLSRPALAADGYANSISSSSAVSLVDPNNALGAPDGNTTGFEANSTFLVLDMGEGEEGTGDLVITQYLRDVGAMMTVTFYSDAWDVLLSHGDFAPIGTTWTFAYSGTTPYRYVRIESVSDHPWSLDAVAATHYEGEPVVIDEPAPDEPVDEEPVDTTPTAGALIRSSELSSVYLLGADGNRHAFPNETVFFSWGYSFDDVVTLTSAELAAYMLGKNVTLKPASHLVKLQTNAKVYAVAPNATLRWVTSESVALSLYGVDWASQVVDVNDVFWPNYTVGDDIDEQADIEGWTIPEDAY